MGEDTNFICSRHHRSCTSSFIQQVVYMQWGAGEGKGPSQTKEPKDLALARKELFDCSAKL